MRGIRRVQLFDGSSASDVSARDVKTFLAPHSAEGMTMWPVDKRVGNVKNNDQSLIEPVAI